MSRYELDTNRKVRQTRRKKSNRISVTHNAIERVWLNQYFCERTNQYRIWIDLCQWKGEFAFLADICWENLFGNEQIEENRRAIEKSEQVATSSTCCDLFVFFVSFVQQKRRTRETEKEIYLSSSHWERFSSFSFVDIISPLPIETFGLLQKRRNTWRVVTIDDRRKSSIRRDKKVFICFSFSDDHPSPMSGDTELNVDNLIARLLEG